MTYTFSITSKGQITIPKEFRERLGLDKAGKATFTTNDRGEIVLERPKDLQDIRALLAKPTHRDPVSENDIKIGQMLAKKYGVS